MLALVVVLWASSALVRAQDVARQPVTLEVAACGVVPVDRAALRRALAAELSGSRFVLASGGGGSEASGDGATRLRIEVPCARRIATATLHLNDAQRSAERRVYLGAESPERASRLLALVAAEFLLTGGAEEAPTDDSGATDASAEDERASAPVAEEPPPATPSASGASDLGEPRSTDGASRSREDAAPSESAMGASTERPRDEADPTSEDPTVEDTAEDTVAAADDDEADALAEPGAASDPAAGANVGVGVAGLLRLWSSGGPLRPGLSVEGVWGWLRVGAQWVPLDAEDAGGTASGQLWLGTVGIRPFEVGWGPVRFTGSFVGRAGHLALDAQAAEGFEGGAIEAFYAEAGGLLEAELFAGAAVRPILGIELGVTLAGAEGRADVDTATERSVVSFSGAYGLLSLGVRLGDTD